MPASSTQHSSKTHSHSRGQLMLCWIIRHSIIWHYYYITINNGYIICHTDHACGITNWWCRRAACSQVYIIVANTHVNTGLHLISFPLPLHTGEVMTVLWSKSALSFDYSSTKQHFLCMQRWHLVFITCFEHCVYMHNAYCFIIISYYYLPSKR